MKRIVAYLRIVKGTETGVLSTMHAFLGRHHDDLDDPCDSVIYGPSASNQVRHFSLQFYYRSKVCTDTHNCCSMVAM